MLEILFNNERIGVSAVKIIGVTEQSKIKSSFLSDDENLLLAKKVLADGFCGKVGTSVEIITKKGKVIALGLGKNPTKLDLQNCGAHLVAKLLKAETAVVCMEKFKSIKFSEAEIAHNLAFGVLLGSYRFDKYFTTKKTEDYPSLERVIFKIKNADEVSDGFKKYAALANAVRYGRDLCNEPANYLTPEVFASDIKRLEYLGLEVEVLGEKELREKNFGCLLAVAKGSALEPKVAIIKWKANNKTDEWDLALVGKGVTFDSGGISIKPSSGMEDMKQDMTGAAVVVASLKALALQCVHKNVIGIVGLVENMPSGNATRPGDVVTSMSGQTVEVINTDAEGRLVLADCLWYIQQEYGVKKIVDIATLTGATMRALGEEYAGIFANDDKFANCLIASGEQTGEKLWRMPLGEGYNKKINSDIADMKNLSGGLAGGSTAACFLERFLQKGVVWAHLDIAGVDKETKGKPLCSKGATAFGIRLLNNFISN